MYGRTDQIEIHVAPDGSPWGDGSESYPVIDLPTAMKLARTRREPGQRVLILVEGGEYPQRETLVLTGADSFTTITATDPDDPPVFTGALPVTGWRPTTLNGLAVWIAPAPASHGRCLYVSGERAPRPRYPAEGHLWIEKQSGLDPAGDFDGTLLQGAFEFGYADGDIPDLERPAEVEAIVPHYWVQERMPIVSIDHDRRVVTSSLRSIFALRDDAAERCARYWLENVAEAFGSRPGEWYLDVDGHLTGAEGAQVLYLPRPGETPESLSARMPLLDVFVRLDGTAADPVREVRFEGLCFTEADFAEAPPAMPPFGVREDPLLDRVGYAAAVQAASTVPGAIQLRHARSCVLLDCRISRVGGYAVALEQGCRGNLVSGCTLTHLGAGGVRCGGAANALSPDFNRSNEVSDNEIVHGGRSYPDCVAILYQHGSHNTIAHNHIADFFYTGISVGWTWDYDDSPSVDNLIADNHIHALGHGLLSDMGGIYLLGIAPGTRVCGNLVHDVRAANYGGWGIYLDAGSSHVVVEGNVVHDVSSHAYHHHYGRENSIRHNVWAFGGIGQVSITKPEPTVSFTFERNIVVGNGTPAFAGTEGELDVLNYRIISDLNLFWDVAPRPGAVRAAVGVRHQRPDAPVEFELTRPRDVEWAAAGHDWHSMEADPGFADLDARDFRVGDDSPAHSLGITPPDVSSAGPRPRSDRDHPLAQPTRRG